MEDLQSHLDEAAQAPVLIVASDYDGTLAPIVDDPDKAEIHRESLVALKSLAETSQTHVAIISGRSLSDLGPHLKGLERAHLVGSHGGEFEVGYAAHLDSKSATLLQKAKETARRISDATPGTRVEEKPAAIAFHFRNADPDAGSKAAHDLLDSLRGEEGLHARNGKKILELSVVKTDKGNALQKLRQRLGATAVIFLGDDLTDEDVFAKLAGPDVGIKVGEGDTAAKFRVNTTEDAARLLARLSEKRQAWVAGSKAVPIERHSMLSDQRTCALIGPQGRVAWLCMPRIDSSALFAEILGGPAAGYFDICPLPAAVLAKQQYVGNTFILKTAWDSIQVIDYLDCSAGRPYQRAGRTDLIRVIEGNGRAKISFAPRINFGTLETRLRVAEKGLVVEGILDACVLFAPGIRWSIVKEGKHDTAVAEVEVKGDPIILELRYGTASFARALTAESDRRAQTDRFWSVWASTLKLPEFHRDLLARSALVLRALVYGPTGAIAAAATTSLPEHAGGVRNWDYRFCWPRDAAMSAMALTKLGAPGPAMKLLDGFIGILEELQPNSLIHPVYTVTGGHLGPEGSIAELSGYRGSRPVRVGNVAAHQVQLDVLGPVAELIAMQAERGMSLTPEHWRMMESMVGAVAQRWRDADHGIWEIRDSRKHHVHSKVMCWQTVNSALKVAEYMGHDRADWIKLRQEIADDVLAHGWHEKAGAFCASYESPEIDAAALWVGLSGLLPPDDPRFISTVQAVERELREGPVVYRYHYDDGLPGIEGGFNICTTWLIESYALLGRWKEAEELFEAYAALAGPTGLMAEEYDPPSKMALGNFPQAYSHLGLINAALRLAAKRLG